MSSQSSRRSARSREGRDATRLLGTTLVGKYRIQNIVGVGGNGIVYEADDIASCRTVAIKVPRRRRAPAYAAMRFRREAKAGSSILHPNVCALHDFGLCEDDTPFLAMERLIGETLSIRLSREGHLPLNVAIHIMRQVLAGLGAAHVRGIVHRDMKPGNIFLTEISTPSPVVKIVDFGSSTFSVEEPEPEEATELVTSIGTAVGTPQYMSPEQICGVRDFDPRVDVFACGVILYEMVTGKKAFRGTDAKALFDQILHVSPRPASSVRRGLPRALDAVLIRAMAVDRRARYPTADAFAAALEGLQISSPTPLVAWSPESMSANPNAERLAYLQARFRELAVLHKRAQADPSTEPKPPRPSTSTLEIPIVVEFDSVRSDAIPRFPRDEDLEGTATTKRKRDSDLPHSVSTETTTANRPRRPRRSRTS